MICFLLKCFDKIIFFYEIGMAANDLQIQPK